jgi:Tetratricopeptide repeat
MNCNLLISCLLLLFASTDAYAASWDEANRQFQSSDFAGAAKSYEKILSVDGPSAAAYYNLGNAYQSLKQYGPAVLAYERASLLTPRDPDLLANLATVRKAANIPEEATRNPQVEAVLTLLSRDEWSWSVVASALLIGGIGLARGVVTVPVKFRLALSTFTGVACLILIFGAAALYLRRAEADRGIILNENAAMRLSPFETAESVGTLGSGRGVKLGVRNGDFTFAEVPNSSLQGWLAEKDVAAISPRTRK